MSLEVVQKQIVSKLFLIIILNPLQFTKQDEHSNHTKLCHGIDTRTQVNPLRSEGVLTCPDIRAFSVAYKQVAKVL